MFISKKNKYRSKKRSSISLKKKSSIKITRIFQKIDEGKLYIVLLIEEFEIVNEISTNTIFEQKDVSDLPDFINGLMNNMNELCIISSIKYTTNEGYDLASTKKSEKNIKKISSKTFNLSPWFSELKKWVGEKITHYNVKHINKITIKIVGYT